MTGKRTGAGTNEARFQELVAKRTFIRRLAEYLVKAQVAMSIKLEIGRPEAKAWCELRATTPLFGYPTGDEAENQLCIWLLGEGAGAKKFVSELE